MMGFDFGALGRTLRAMTGFIAAGILVFGMSWLLSLFLDSVVVTALAGLMFMIPVWLMQYLANWYFEIENPAFFHAIAVGLMTVAGAIGVALGTLHFLRTDHERTESTLERNLSRKTASVSLSLREQKTIGHLRALLWKDFQLVKLPLLFGTGALLVPYAVCAATAHFADSVWAAFRTAALVSIALGGLIFPFWSGHIVSTEYLSKASCFLGVLPVPRTKAVVSKLILTLMPAAAISALNLILLLAFNSSMDGTVIFDHNLKWEDVSQVPFIVMGYALMNGGIMGFSLSWLLSARYKRPAVAIVSGIMMTPLSVGLWAALSSYCIDAAFDVTPVQFTYAYTCTVISIGLGIILTSWRVSKEAMDE